MTASDLLVSVRKGDAFRVNELLKNGLNPDPKGCRSWKDMPLMVAADGNKVEILNNLIGYKANINMKDTDGRTAMFCAAVNGHANVIKILIGAGADPNIKNNFGLTALHIACGKGHLGCISALVESGLADPALKDNDGQTARDEAKKNKQNEAIDLLDGLVAKGPVKATPVVASPGVTVATSAAKGDDVAALRQELENMKKIISELQSRVATLESQH